MHNRFKNRNTNIKKKEYLMVPTDYPALSNNISNNIVESDANFANAILKPIDLTIDNNILPPGWISIKYENNKFIYKYGPKTNKQYMEEKRLENEKDPNVIMNNICYNINRNRERYINEFNEINGPYAYEDLYVTNVNSEYSDDEEEEEEMEEI